MDDVVIPDEKDLSAKNVFQRIKKQVDEKSEESKTENLYYLLNNYNGWLNGLKPYIQERIRVFKEMEEINFSGNETMQDIGVRYMICHFIASELQRIIDRVEIISEQIAVNKEIAKKRKKVKKHG